MSSLSFVVPVHGRLPLAAICLRQLRRTCDALTAEGVQSVAVVVSDEETLEMLDPASLGFATVERDNQFLGRRYNDGIQLATDPAFNPNPVDYVVPFGSDDWADHRLFLEPLPDAHTIFGFQHLSFVNEAGTEIASTFLNYEGGCGIRVIPRDLVAGLGYRPADDDRPEACDASILTNLRRHLGDRLKVKHWDAPAEWIVDWKTSGNQLHAYDNVPGAHTLRKQSDPFTVLADFYAPEALEEMAEYYVAPRMVAA